MIEKIIERFNRESQQSPFEEGEAYYNEDVGDVFVVDQIEPEFRLTYQKDGTSRFYDSDIYEWKYQENVIREVDR